MQPRLLHEPIRLAGASLLRVQSDARLVALARDGHDPAFATIVDRYRGALVRYCSRLLGPARAEDAVQQVLLNAHTAMIKDDRDIELRPWLYRIAHNVSLNTLRGARETDVLSGERADPASLEDAVADREHLRATLAAISALPEPQRDAIVLREIEGRSHEEIAVALGVSVGGARQHLHRARTAVRTTMTAITPYPLLVRLMEVASSSGVSESGAARAGEVAVGTGLSAVATKVGVGALAAGALAGGAIHAEQTNHHRHRLAPQAHVASPLNTPKAAAAKLVPAAAGASAAVVIPVAASGQRRDDNASTTETEHHATHTATKHHGSGDDHSSGSETSGDDHGSTSGSGSGSTGDSGHHGSDDPPSATSHGSDHEGSSGSGTDSGSGHGGSSGSSGKDSSESSGSGSSGSGSSGKDSNGSGGEGSSPSPPPEPPGDGASTPPPPPPTSGGDDGSGGSGSSGSGDSGRGGSSGGSGSSGGGDSPDD